MYQPDVPFRHERFATVSSSCENCFDSNVQNTTQSSPLSSDWDVPFLVLQLINKLMIRPKKLALSLRRTHTAEQFHAKK